VKNYKVEELNYTDTDRLIEALTYYLGTREGKIGTYNLELLRKLERNKRILFDTPDETTMESGNING
jgi:hypothetical protein